MERVRLLNIYILIETFPKSRPDNFTFREKSRGNENGELEERNAFIYILATDSESR